MVEPAVVAPRDSLRSVLALITALATLATLSALGCGGPGGQFYVVQNQVAGEGCTIPTDKSSLYQGEGVLDIRVPTTGDAAYLLFPLLQNDLPTEGDTGVEPNRIDRPERVAHAIALIEAAEVAIRLSASFVAMGPET